VQSYFRLMRMEHITLVDIYHNPLTQPNEITRSTIMNSSPSSVL
jgi:hypothetical protein